MLPGAAGCYWVLPGAAGLVRAASTSGCCWVLPGCRVAGLPGCRVTAGSLPHHCRVICCRGRGRGATRRPRSARANLPSLLTLLLALDCRHTPPLLAGCGWLRSWDACPHRRSCALRVGSLCASCARLFAGSAAWRSDSRAHARTQTVSFSEAGNTYICSLKTRFTQITHSVRTDAIYRVAHTTTSSRTNS